MGAPRYHVPVPHEMPDDFDVDVQFTRFIRRTRLRALRGLDTIAPTLDYGSYLILATIYDAPEGVRASEIAEAFGVHKSTISRAVSSLEKLDLVARKPDPEDGRAQLLTVPAEAAERIQTFRRGVHAWFEGLLDGWTGEERTTLARLVKRLNETPDPQ